MQHFAPPPAALARPLEPDTTRRSSRSQSCSRGGLESCVSSAGSSSPLVTLLLPSRYASVPLPSIVRRCAWPHWHCAMVSTERVTGLSAVSTLALVLGAVFLHALCHATQPSSWCGCITRRPIGPGRVVVHPLVVRSSLVLQASWRSQQSVLCLCPLLAVRRPAAVRLVPVLCGVWRASAGCTAHRPLPTHANVADTQHSPLPPHARAAVTADARSSLIDALSCGHVLCGAVVVSVPCRSACQSVC